MNPAQIIEYSLWTEESKLANPQIVILIVNIRQNQLATFLMEISLNHSNKFEKVSTSTSKHVFLELPGEKLSECTISGISTSTYHQHLNFVGIHSAHAILNIHKLRQF